MKHVCPPWLGPLFAAPLRRRFQDPEKILAPYISPGDTALEIGPAMGFFTIPMAGLLGDDGRVIAADLQPEMLDGLRERAERAGRRNIIFHQCSEDSLMLDDFSGSADFALIFWMLHEVPDSGRLISEVRDATRDGALLLYAEPFLHVSRSAYMKNVEIIQRAGFETKGYPKIAFSRASLFQKR
jgi:ubiquinone/menaquinone biosynthesis C-methylase UbiE